jgi:hypothetical protein
MMAAKTTQVVSKQRVADHGEVYTSEREVKAMLDLVKQETERIDSRFLEPACGTGNFLAEILRRKLRVVESRYRRSRLEYERYAVLAVSSIYGIDILLDNVIECRRRLFDQFDAAYTRLYRAEARDECRAAVRFILDRNIIHGDALTLKCVAADGQPGEDHQPIVFSEWSLVTGNMLKRRDFTFRELLDRAERKDLALFAADREAFIPEPVKEYPSVHFLRVGEMEADDAP